MSNLFPLPFKVISAAATGHQYKWNSCARGRSGFVARARCFSPLSVTSLQTWRGCCEIRGEKIKQYILYPMDFLPSSQVIRVSCKSDVVACGEKVNCCPRRKIKAQCLIRSSLMQRGTLTHSSSLHLWKPTLFFITMGLKAGL